MKRAVFFLLILGTVSSAIAQVRLPDYRFVTGSWSITGSRVYQNDAAHRLAKMNLQVAQSGPMLYEFNARYESGADDGQGGFGIHIFADTAYNGASWGCGNSYLLWLNYDEKPQSPAIHRGLSAQLYRSYTNSRMDLVESFDLNEYADLLTPENLAYPVPFKIEVDGDTGEVRVYDPTDPDLSLYRYFTIDTKGRPLSGGWMALRTNGITMSFAMGL